MQNPSPAATLSRHPNLADLLISAKIDFLTIETSEKIALPKLDGKAIWPKSYAGARLTVHDATASDVAALVLLFGGARLCELEVAVDFRPRSAVDPAERRVLLEAVMVNLIARELNPSEGNCMVMHFRARYRQIGAVGTTAPFNLKLPLPTDQLLYGSRDDPAQVKCYLKGTDMNRALPQSEHVARVEVRLSDALVQHGLLRLDDLMGFTFRKSLSRYFVFVSGTKRRMSNSKLKGPLRAFMNSGHNSKDASLMEQAGVGQFCAGGNGQGDKVRLTRNRVVNNRIGQALYRLETQFALKNFVCLTVDSDEDFTGATEESSVLSTQSSMTN
jgi:hypothetical protein